MDQKVAPQGSTENAWYKYEMDYEATNPLLTLWQMIMFFPTIICVAVTSVFVLIGWGPKRFRRMWAEAMHDPVS